MKIVNRVLLGLVIVLPVSVFAASETKTESAENDQWRFEATPYFWFASIKGDSTMSGVTGDVDFSFSDIFDNLNYGGAVRLDAYKGKWGLKSDVLVLDLESSFDAPPGPGDIDIRQWMVDFAVSYQVLSMPMDKEGRTKLTFSPYGGFRYNYLKQDAKLPGPIGKVGGDQDWIDILVGGSVKMKFNEKLSANVEGDVAGFGIGSGSDLTWQIIAGFNYELSDNIDLKIGYRHFDMDYSRGHGSEKFGMNAYFTGPMAGLTIKW